jgi:hypothetical protein
MSFEIKPATRSSVKALVGFYGKSGGGKTMSALLFARGLVGPSGRIVGIDTENHRMSLFADQIPGGYSVIDLAEPFTPERYVEAIEVAEQAADVVLVDSMSHEWAGEGGVLDMQDAELDRMAGQDWKKREQCRMAAWIRPKMVHKKFVQRLLRSPVHILCCLRGEEKTRMDKGPDGKRVVEKDDFCTCIADSRFIFEMTVNLECYAKEGNGGFIIIRKTTHPGIRACLPGPSEQVGVKHGEALARWCAGADPCPSAPTRHAPQGVLTVPDLKKELMDLLAPRLKATTKPGRKVEAEVWLRERALLGDAENIEVLSTAERLTHTIDEVKTILSDVIP